MTRWGRIELELDDNVLSRLLAARAAGESVEEAATRLLLAALPAPPARRALPAPGAAEPGR